MCRQRGLDPNGSELELLKRLNEAATTSSTIASSTAGYGRVTAITTTTSAGANTGSMKEVHMRGHGIHEEDHHHHHPNHDQHQQPQYQHNDDTIEYDLGEDDYDATAAADDDSHDLLRIIDGEDDDSSDDDNVHIIEEDDALELNDEEMFGVGDNYDVEKDEDDEGDDDHYDI
jgi:hypothetical protein